ncbi:MAG: hypothetical protein ACD_76C00125G0005 [uncultured bacterium]|nr:MAG: hypothetical protein ACD_76C00125G0005 [uncultured bacterium]HBD05494.1 rRNA maturation RNase YbeY [Candidatus Uhrbacteria bacterium]
MIINVIKFEINQSALSSGQKISDLLAKKIATVISRKFNLKRTVRISVGFVRPAQMRELNKKYRRKNKPTDVLSFCLEEDDLLGEIVLCYSEIKQRTPSSSTVKNEVIKALVHGALHLFGFDHEKPRDAKIMLPLQEIIIKNL